MLIIDVLSLSYGVRHAGGSRRVVTLPPSSFTFPLFFRRVAAVLAFALAAAVVLPLATSPAALAGPGYGIYGTVTDGGANPVESCHVLAFDINDNAWVADVTTDASGYYDMDWLTNGHLFKVLFLPAGSSLAMEWYTDAGTWDDATSFAAPFEANAQLEAGASLTGTVTEEGSGDPLGNTHVQAYDSTSNKWLKGVYSEPSGQYALEGLRSGVTYKVLFSIDDGYHQDEWYSDAPGTWETGGGIVAPAGGVNAELTVLPRYISGTVTTDGVTPVADCQVYAYDISEGWWVSSATTDANGEYTVGGLEEGHMHKLFFRPGGGFAMEWYNNADTWSQAGEVQAPNTGINAEVEAGVSITGTVTEEDSGGLLEDIWVQVFDSTSDKWLAGTYTDADGGYSLDGLRSGVTYKVYFWSEDSHYDSEWNENKADWELADGVTAPLSDLNAQLALIGTQASISGTVTNFTTGQPVEGATVRVYNDSQVLIQETQTDETGAYTFYPLQVGGYRVQFIPVLRNYKTQWWQEKDDFATAFQIVLAAGEQKPGVNAALREKEPAAVSGRVTSDGAPVPYCLVLAYDVVEGTNPTYTYTDDQGYYTLGSLLEGDQYKVLFLPDDGIHATEWYTNAGTWDGATAVTAPSANVDASLESAAVISGRVTDASGGVNGVRVQAYDVTSEKWLTSTYTDSNGDYWLSGLREGFSYKIYFGAGDGYHQDEWHQDNHIGWATADAVAAPSSGVNAELTVLGRYISGKVTSDGTTPVMNCTVNAYNATSGELTSSTYTDELGEYTVGWLTEGEQYKVHFVPQGSEHAIEWYGNQGAWTDATEIMAPCAGIDVVLESGVSITGTVTGDCDVPLSGISIYAYDATTNQQLKSASSGETGEYVLGGLREGASYKIFFSGSPYDGEWFEDYHGDWGSAGTVTAPDTEINAEMLLPGEKPTPNVTGIVPDHGMRGTLLDDMQIQGYKFRDVATTIELRYSGYAPIAASDIKFVSANLVTADFNVPEDAVLGVGWDLYYIHNDDGKSDTLISCFTMEEKNYPAPDVTGVTPDEGVRGTSVDMTIAGASFRNVPMTVELRRDGAAISGSVTSVEADQVGARFDIPAGATVADDWDLYLEHTDDGKSDTLADCFSVTYPPPVVTSVTPDVGYTSEAAQAADISGSGFMFNSTVRLVKVDPDPVNPESPITGSITSGSSEQISCTFDLTGAALGDWKVEVSNPDGQTSDGSVLFTVENAPPDVTGISPNHGIRGTVLDNVQISGEDFRDPVEGLTVELRKDAAVIQGADVSYASANLITADFALPEGAALGKWNLYLEHGDDNKNDSFANCFSVAIVQTEPPPDVTGVSPNLGTRGQAVTGVLISGSDFRDTEAGVTVQLERGGEVVEGTVVSVTATEVTADFIIPFSVAAGVDWDLRLIHNDDLADDVLPDCFTVENPVSTIGGMNPVSQMAGGADFNLTVYGTGFGQDSVVRWNGSDRATACVSPGELTAAIPAGDIVMYGTADVTVFNPVPGGGESGAVAFTINASPPTLTSISPTYGYVASAVTLTGTNFGTSQGASTVKFGTTNAAITSWGNTTIKVVVPSTVSGSLSVTVTTPGGASNAVTFKVVPKIMSISPTSGYVSTLVTINGYAFGATRGTSYVKFGPYKATSYTSWTNKVIKVRVPTSASRLPKVIVTTSGGSSNYKTFKVKPKMTSITPTSGKAGTVVAIKGYAFGPTKYSTSYAKFGTVKGTSYPFWGNTLVKVKVPSGVVGKVKLVMVTAGGTSNYIYFMVKR
jgi:hypothetical protein